MTFLDRLTNTISAAGKDGINIAKDLKDSAKITMDIKEREGAIQRMYRDLGKAYYQDHCDDENLEYDQILAITAAFEEIEELKASKDSVRGINRCPECDSPVKPGSNFCPNCGAKYEPPVEECECEVVEDEETEEEAEELEEEEILEEEADEAVAEAEAVVEEVVEETVEEVAAEEPVAEEAAAEEEAVEE